MRGVGQTVLGLYRAMTQVRPNWCFDLYYQTPNGTDPFTDAPQLTPRQIDGPGDRFQAWQQIWFPLAVRRSGADILHTPGAVAPRFPLTPLVTTIHDLTPLEFWPNDPGVKAWARNAARGARNARRVLVCSEHTRNEVIRVFRTPAHKIEVVRWGPNDAIQQARDPAVLQETCLRYGVEPGQSFLLHFGMMIPRKNTRRVLEAWSALPQAVRRQARLVVVGLEGESHGTFQQLGTELGIADSLCLHGYIPKADIPALLSAALGLIYVPLSEGFGLPILDAFVCETPVLASRVTSIPEVTGAAALMIDPHDPTAITAAMHRLLTDSNTREELRSLGRERLSLFSWSACAEQIATTFETVR